jgi:hypothetical protein
MQRFRRHLAGVDFKAAPHKDRSAVLQSIAFTRSEIRTVTDRMTTGFLVKAVHS